MKRREPRPLDDGSFESRLFLPGVFHNALTYVEVSRGTFDESCPENIGFILRAVSRQIVLQLDALEHLLDLPSFPSLLQGPLTRMIPDRSSERKSVQHSNLLKRSSDASCATGVVRRTTPPRRKVSIAMFEEKTAYIPS